jgi:hypothetical protein
MVFRIKEIAKLDKATTKITEIAMTKVGCICVVTANEEQIPSTCTVTGLSSISGSVINFLLLLESKGSAGFTATDFSIVSALIVALVLMSF